MQSYVDQFRGVGATQVSIITLGQLSKWRPTDPVPYVLDTRAVVRVQRRDRVSRRVIMPLANRTKRLRMWWGLARNKPARQLLATADLVYVDQVAAVPTAWLASRRTPTTPYVTSPARATYLIGQIADSA
ncbi:hypothetical protein ON058_02625 [Demequina sp. B12]|uniref:hypothetical protein n=1 Tax=Demequina sp. B12 TaxID=2992757 RepID=UPI00237AD9F9|nr:hypothetical protein [Demequina sp. B12]MDE0572304.1 hypothetical protein [Demequina sp. B12]